MTNSNYNIEAEQSVLGGLMLTTDEKRINGVLSTVRSSHFYVKANADIYDACVRLIEKGEVPDIITLDNELSNSPSVSDLGGFAYLGQIASSVPSAANIITYANIIKDLSNKRTLINVVTNCIEVASNADGRTVTEQLDSIYNTLEDFGESIRSGRSGELEPMSNIMRGVIETLERRAKGEEKGLTTGIKELDDLLGFKGVVKNALFVVGARPKMGKTSFLTKILEHVGIDLGLPCPFFSLEMSSLEVGERMLSQASGVNLDALMTPATEADYLWGSVSSGMARLNSENILVCDKPAQNVRGIINACRKLKRERGRIGMVGVDYLTLMEGEDAERNDLKYGSITKKLKNLAKEIEAPVFLLTQLNRNLESRQNKRPKPSDSRDTGQIEQDCDYWVGLYRDDVYHPETNCPGFMEIGLEMNRHGQTGVALAKMTEGRISDKPDGVNYVPYDEQQNSNRYKEKDF